MSALRIAIIGTGKMGKAVRDLAEARGDAVVAGIGRGDTIDTATLANADVAIEFTEPASAVANIEACLAAKVPIVVGTTGWSDDIERVRTAVTKSGGSLFYASNFSIGAAILGDLLARAGALFAAHPGFDVAMIEAHHIEKKDAPSGTALTLATRLRETLGRDVPISSVRVGSVPGTHELLADAPYEQIRLMHDVRDRRVFAAGALDAAHWLVGRTGVFTMTDLLAPGDKT